jgi:uncharacterized protein YciI
MYYLLSYEFVENMTDRRTPYRAAHLALASAAHARGDLVLAGAFAEAPAGAVLVFRTGEPSVVERFVAADPYVANGLVTRWQIRALQVAFGG